MKLKNSNLMNSVVVSAAGLVFCFVSLALVFDDPKDPKDTGSFTYEYDPRYTHALAFEVNAPYEGIPKPLGQKPSSGYVQPWSGYDPECTLKDKDLCKSLPSQTFNLKPDATYAGVEVGDNKWQAMANAEALISVQNKGGPFGAVILQIDDETHEVIRYWRNHNHVTEWNDPTAHAEVTTIRMACKQLGVFDMGKILKENSKLPQKGATSHCEIYVNGDPCPMCYGAIFWAKIPVVVFGATRFDAAAQGVDFGDAALYGELSTPNIDKTRTVRQSSSPGSLDAFNFWKRTPKTKY